MKNIKTISIVSIAILMIFSICIIGANKGINNTKTVKTAERTTKVAIKATQKVAKTTVKATQTSIKHLLQ